MHRCAWGGKPQSVSSMPHLAQLSANLGAGCKNGSRCKMLWDKCGGRDKGILDANKAHLLHNMTDRNEAQGCQV